MGPPHRSVAEAQIDGVVAIDRPDDRGRIGRTSLRAGIGGRVMDGQPLRRKGVD